MSDQTETLDTLCAGILRVLFELAQADRAAHVGALARELRLGKTAVADALVRLDRAGLVRAERARLTMRGLAVAARLPAQGLRSPSLVPPPRPVKAVATFPSGLAQARLSSSR